MIITLFLVFLHHRRKRNVASNSAKNFSKGCYSNATSTDYINNTTGLQISPDDENERVETYVSKFELGGSSCLFHCNPDVDSGCTTELKYLPPGGKYATIATATRPCHEGAKMRTNLCSASRCSSSNIEMSCIDRRISGEPSVNITGWC